MKIMCEVPVDVVDELPGVEYRIAFLGAACGALAALDEASLDAMTGKRVWEGLFHWTQDLERMLREMNEQLDPDSTSSSEK